MAPFFWRFQAREASGRSLATPLLREIQGDPGGSPTRSGFLRGSSSTLAELTFGPRVDAFGSSMTKAQIFIGHLFGLIVGVIDVSALLA